MTVDSGLEKAAFNRARDSCQGSANKQAELSKPAKFMLKGKRILVVEDSPDLRALFSRMLKSSGATVDVRFDGIDGVEQALSAPYDAVLMDLQMPRCDGFMATAKLRRLGVSTPIIALSAFAMKDDRERALKAGCNTHLTKPVTAQILVKVVADMVQQ